MDLPSSGSHWPFSDTFGHDEPPPGPGPRTTKGAMCASGMSVKNLRMGFARQEVRWAVRWRRFGGRLAGAGTLGAGTARQA